MEKIFKPEEIDNFVHEHIQQKIDNNELSLVGFDLTDINVFQKELEIYKLALFEGVVNGIVMGGGKIEGIETE